ncbi:MAG: polysaccharide export protein [Gammaproteobacteria bacterium]|nr:polysaccharide export protein [Gammaproteobacteria bacterium]MDH5239230.1 polysaccharide export protein [Gammaproteobacteria bacterium]MDH5259905.1 polysaccharide export protein [Gammaproteobacteria bacterium]
MQAVLSVAACGGTPGVPATSSETEGRPAVEYVIGPGDGLQVFVWGHDDLSTSIQVRPDGAISTPLVENIPAAGRTPSELARALEEALGEYIRTPTVTVIVQEFIGEFDQQIRVVGQAAEPRALNYRAGMSLLDVMIEVGGLSEFAAGNRSKIVRKENGKEVIIEVRIKDLLNKGELSQNVQMKPGDVLIIPESIF